MAQMGVFYSKLNLRHLPDQTGQESPDCILMYT